MSAPVVDSFLALAEATPLVRLRSPGTAALWAKCEHLLPSGSLKDRSADAVLAASGAQAGDTVVVASSGSSAGALALAGKLRGVKVAAAMPRGMALEKRSLLRALGVRLVLTEAALGMEGARAAADEMAEKESLRRVSMEHATGRARGRGDRRRARARADVLVVPVGSGATLRAMAGVLAGRGTRTIGVTACRTDTRIAGLAPAPFAIEGASEMRSVEDTVAWQTARRLAREQGLLVGPSAGAVVAVASEIVASAGPEQNVVAVLGDTGERYFSLGQFFDVGTPP